MNRLSLCISQDDYSVQYGCSAQSSVTTGGFNRYFKRTNSKRHVVTCTTTLSEADYWYFRAFYLDWQNEPQPFICKLVLEGFDYYGSLLQDYECSFVKDSVMFDLNALHFRVSFQLDVFINPLFALTSRPYPLESTESILADFGILDAESRDLLTHLDIGGDSVFAAFSIIDVVMSDSEAIYNPQPEKIASSFKVLDCILANDGPLSYTLVEKIKPSLSIKNAVLANDLIEHTATPEKIKPSFSVLSAQYGDS